MCTQLNPIPVLRDSRSLELLCVWKPILRLGTSNLLNATYDHERALWTMLILRLIFESFMADLQHIGTWTTFYDKSYLLFNNMTAAQALLTS